MLYICSCDSFSSRKNNYREVASSFVVDYFKKFYFENKIKIDTSILSVFFEVGGLAQEYYILSNILPYLTDCTFYIVLIESLPSEKTELAYRTFKKKLALYKNILFYYFHSVEDFFCNQNLILLVYDFVFLGSFDPYFYFCFSYREKILNKIKYTNLCLEVYLYFYYGYFHKEVIEFFIHEKSKCLHGFYSLSKQQCYSLKIKKDRNL